MSLDQIRSFVAVAEEGAVVRAAARLHISQPPLTRRIRALEDELGTPLFRRRARGMELTPAGAVFLPHARGILAAVHTARSALGVPPAGQGTPAGQDSGGEPRHRSSAHPLSARRKV